MTEDLSECFMLAQNNEQEYVIHLYNKFLPMIKGFGRKLNYEEAESDLTIFLLELIKNIDIRKFKNRNDGEIVNYIHSAFKSRYINILRSIARKNIEILANETDFVCNDCYNNLESIYIRDLIKHLSCTQKKIILGAFYYGYSDAELAFIFKVSRQAINKQKKKALSLLKLEILKAGDNHGRKDI